MQRDRACNKAITPRAHARGSPPTSTQMHQVVYSQNIASQIHYQHIDLFHFQSFWKVVFGAQTSIYLFSPVGQIQISDVETNAHINMFSTHTKTVLLNGFKPLHF